MTPVYLGRPSRREGPEYSSVLVPIDDECDPPPPYPGTEDLPPPYWSIFPPKESEIPWANLPAVITSGDGGGGNNNGITAIPTNGNANSTMISHHRDRSRRQSNETSENGEPRRRPIGPRIVACFDMVLNCPFLFPFLLDQMGDFRLSYNPIVQFILFLCNLFWIKDAYELYRSTDPRLSSSERIELTKGWEIINNFLIFGLFTTFCIYLVVAAGRLNEQRNKRVELLRLLSITVPFGIRLIFFVIIQGYNLGF